MTVNRDNSRIRTATRFTAVAMLLVFGLASTADDREDPRAFKDWQARWTKMLNSMGNIDPEQDLAYTEHRRGSVRDVVTLAEPLATHTPVGVEVEWFFTYLADTNNVGKITYVLDQWNDIWLKSLRRHGLDSVTFIATPVSHIEGLEGGWNAHRERHQEIVLAYGGPRPGLEHSLHKTLARTLADGERALTIRSQQDAERFLEDHTGRNRDVEHYRRVAGTPELKARMQANDERLAQVFEQARRTHPDTVLSPHDPIFLINGKYLITGSNTARSGVAAAYQLANRFITRELRGSWTRADARWAAQRAKEAKRLRPNHIDPTPMAYGTTGRAVQRRAIALDHAIPSPDDGPAVEFFFSAETATSRTAKTLFHRWRRTWPDGIASRLSPVQTHRISNAAVTGRHQEIMLAGYPVHWGDTLQVTLRNRFRRLADPGYIASEEDFDALLADLKMPRADYDTGLNHPDTRGRIQAINEAWRKITAAATNGRNPDMRRADPVLVINGRHLLVGHRFKDWEQLFHTANALLEQELTAAK